MKAIFVEQMREQHIETVLRQRQSEHKECMIMDSRFRTTKSNEIGKESIQH